MTNEVKAPAAIHMIALTMPELMKLAGIEGGAWIEYIDGRGRSMFLDTEGKIIFTASIKGPDQAQIVPVSRDK